ncbi:MAG: hypothetical protein SGARI_007028 [Bacillariaceae sp.]
MVQNIEADCERRMERAKSTAPFKPRRLLIPVGGTGAQKTFINAFIEATQDLINDGKLQLFLNAGDHKHMKTAFVEQLEKCDLDYDLIDTTQGVRDFQKKLLNPRNEPNKAITLFAFEEYFPPLLQPTCSALAFYCIPKLHIRRVGDHEAESARRAAEAGDGSLEAREVSDAMRYLDLILEQPPDLLVSWNEAILRNNTIGMYDGCKNAVKFAIEN